MGMSSRSGPISSVPGASRGPVNTGDARTEKLFAYGTLQLESVQVATFDRHLTGRGDALAGFRLVPLRIDDRRVIEVSGQAEHTMARYTGRASDVIRGTVFDLTAKELNEADSYEVEAVRRVALGLRSGIRAWVYVDGLSELPPDIR